MHDMVLDDQLLRGKETEEPNETHAFRGVVMISEMSVNGTGLEEGRSVIVRVVIPSSGRLTTVAIPREACRVFIMVILRAEIVTLIVAVEVSSIVIYACEAAYRVGGLNGWVGATGDGSR